jgi:hypothetical protein
MQHMDRGRETHRIDRPIRAAAVILDHLEHARAIETLSRNNRMRGDSGAAGSGRSRLSD